MIYYKKTIEHNNNNNNNNKNKNKKRNNLLNKAWSYFSLNNIYRISILINLSYWNHLLASTIHLNPCQSVLQYFTKLLSFSFLSDLLSSTSYSNDDVLLIIIY